MVRKIIKYSAILLLASMLFLPGHKVARAVGSDIFVTPGGSTTSGCIQSDPCDLPTAMSLAVEGDTLYFSPGTYYGSGTDPVLFIDKDLTLYGGWDGTTTTPIVVDPETYISILDGENTRRGIAVVSESAPLIEGFTITHGQAYDGAGIYVVDSSPTIQKNIITDNHTIDGGFYDDGRGGGIYIEDGTQVSLIDNIISENSAGFGGGYNSFYSNPTTIQSNVFLNNAASYRGGGMMIERPADIIKNNIFEGNSTAGDGGAIIIWSADPLIDANWFEANSALDGSALSLGNNARPGITNNVLVNQGGSTVSIYGSSPQFFNNTLVGTNIPSTKGVEMTGSAGCSPPACPGGDFYNNIIAGFEVGFEIGTGDLGTLGLDNNAYWSNNQNYVLPSGVDPGVSNVFADPLFVNQVSMDYHLQPSSPCIDTGTAVGAPAEDFEGTLRPLGAGVDIGAFEVSVFYSHLPLVIK